jgi:hypothetical protein
MFQEPKLDARLGRILGLAGLYASVDDKTGDVGTRRKHCVGPHHIIDTDAAFLLRIRRQKSQLAREFMDILIGGSSRKTEILCYESIVTRGILRDAQGSPEFPIRFPVQLIRLDECLTHAISRSKEHEIDWDSLVFLHFDHIADFNVAAFDGFDGAEELVVLRIGFGVAATTGNVVEGLAAHGYDEDKDERDDVGG